MTSMEFGPVVVDTFPEAVVASLIGAVLLMIELFIANVVVSILRRYVSVRIAGFRFGQDAWGTPFVKEDVGRGVKTEEAPQIYWGASSYASG